MDAFLIFLITRLTKMNIRILYFLLMVSLLAMYCKEDAKKQIVSNKKEELKLPSFNKDSAFQFVRQQLLFGPRIPNTDAHRKCAAWYVEKFTAYGADVIQQKFQAKAFDGTLLNGNNIIAQINPTAKRRITLAAHWDTRPWSDADPDPKMQKKSFPSADDGPSGVAVLIELARIIQTQTLTGIGVDFVLFDLEDYGSESTANTDKLKTWGLGSQYWSANLHVSGYRPMYGVLLDMVGGANPGFYTEDYSVYYAKDIVEKVWSLAASMGYSSFFPRASGDGVTDDHYFVNTIAKIPLIDIINRPDGKKFPHYHHTQKDNIDVIDPYTLLMVGKLMTKLIYMENEGL